MGRHAARLLPSCGDFDERGFIDESGSSDWPIISDNISAIGTACRALQLHLTVKLNFVSSQVVDIYGAVAKWLRQRIANPPSSVQLRPAPFIVFGRNMTHNFALYFILRHDGRLHRGFKKAGFVALNRT